MSTKGVRCHVLIWPKEPEKIRETMEELAKNTRMSEGNIFFEVCEQINAKGMDIFRKNRSKYQGYFLCDMVSGRH